VPKASRVLAALKRDGWVEVRRAGSHRTLRRATATQLWAHHDGKDLGNSNMRDVAADFGYTLEQLRKLI